MKAPSLEGVNPREKNLEIQRVVLSWPQNAAVVSIRFQITEGERICVQCFSRAFSYLCLTRKNVCGCMLFAGAGRRRTLEAAAYNSWNSCQIPQLGGKWAVPPIQCTGRFAKDSLFLKCRFLAFCNPCTNRSRQAAWL